ncbi:DUF4236 domain-containing protein [Chitinophaga sp.]|uniref:DUF4236 domain-containing protein n=1 Tax=Chitinophaga sp. TaxID=1869181 RepID=UPI0031D91337
MAWTYRKRIKIIPGVHLNISKKGISTNIGVKGASVTFGHDGAYVNSVLGRHKTSSKPALPPPKPALPVPGPRPGIAVAAPQGNIFSIAPTEITNQDMQGVKDAILSAHQQRKELQHDLQQIGLALKKSKSQLTLSYVFLYGLFVQSVSKGIKEKIASQQTAIDEIKQELEKSRMELDITFDTDILQKYESVTTAFKRLSQSHKVWDVTSAFAENRRVTRSAASTLVDKKEVKIGIKSIEDIQSNFEPLWFKNANGADLYFYPGFIIMYDTKDRFGIIDLKELHFNFLPVRFIERGFVPPDAKVIDHTWNKVNKNGAPDKRFRDNFQIPIVRYGAITLRTDAGVHEEYEFSNYEAAEAFSEAFIDFQNVIRGGY